MLTPKQTTWVVIADGARARILANEGPNSGLIPVPGTAHEKPTPKTADLGADKPGRSLNSVGDGRSAMDNTDWHQFEEQKFAHDVAGLLDVAARAGDFDQLVLVAPPKTLGELRAGLNAATRAKVIAELPKDLTKHPLADLPSHLESVMRL